MKDIEKIRAEIERRITDNTFGAKLELIDLLSFIDSLEQEPQGLDEAAAEYADGPEATWHSISALEYAFKAGAKWMAEQGQSKEGVVVDNDFINFDNGATFIDVCPTQETPAFNIKNCDKVIVQIRKKD